MKPYICGYCLQPRLWGQPECTMHSATPQLVAALSNLVRVVQQRYGYATADGWPEIAAARAALNAARGEG